MASIKPKTARNRTLKHYTARHDKHLDRGREMKAKTARNGIIRKPRRTDEHEIRGRKNGFKRTRTKKMRKFAQTRRRMDSDHDFR